MKLCGAVSSWSQRQQSLRYKKFYLIDRCRCDRWIVASIWSLNFFSSAIAAITAIIWKPDLIYLNYHPPFLLNCYLYALQTYQTHFSKLRLLLVNTQHGRNYSYYVTRNLNGFGFREIMLLEWFLWKASTAGYNNTIKLFVLPRKFCISIVFNFSWNLQMSKEELKTIIYANFWRDKKRRYFWKRPVVKTTTYLKTPFHSICFILLHFPLDIISNRNARRCLMRYGTGI